MTCMTQKVTRTSGRELKMLREESSDSSESTLCTLTRANSSCLIMKEERLKNTSEYWGAFCKPKVAVNLDVSSAMKRRDSSCAPCYILSFVEKWTCRSHQLTRAWETSVIRTKMDAVHGLTSPTMSHFKAK